MLVEGQICGGVAQGLGGALLEEFRFDDLGQPQRRRSWTTYCRPSGDVPVIDVLLTEDAPSPLNPLGVKGAGEGGTTGVGAAIASAVDDALGRRGDRRLPITPAESRHAVRRRLRVLVRENKERAVRTASARRVARRPRTPP